MDFGRFLIGRSILGRGRGIPLSTNFENNKKAMAIRTKPLQGASHAGPEVALHQLTKHQFFLLTLL